jgi:hypothetical protein
LSKNLITAYKYKADNSAKGGLYVRCYFQKKQFEFGVLGKLKKTLQNLLFLRKKIRRAKHYTFG